MRQLFSTAFLALAVGVPAGAQNWSHYISDMTVNDVVEHQNQWWIATDRGIYTVDKATEQVSHFDGGNSVLPSDHIQTLSKDAANNLWIGTYDLAMVKVPTSGGAWEVVNYPTLTNAPIIYDSQTDAAGHVWLGTNQGLLEYDGSQWAHHPVPTGMLLGNTTPIWSLGLTGDGKVFGASFNLLRFENGNWTELSDTTDIMSCYTDGYVCVENDTTVWYFTDVRGVLRYHNQQWDRWYSQDFLGSPFVPMEPNMSNLDAQIMPGSGHIYYNTYDNSLVYYDGQQWVVDGSLAAAMPNGSTVQQFHLDNNGTAWGMSKNLCVKTQNGNTSTIELAPLYDVYWGTLLSPDKNGKMHLVDYSDGIYSVEASGWQQQLVTASNTPITIYEALTFDQDNEAWFISRVNGHPVIVEEHNGHWTIHDHSSSGGVLPLSSLPDYSYLFDIVINKNNTVWVTDENYNILQYNNGVWTQLSPIANNAYASGITADGHGNFWWVERLFNSSSTLKKYDGISVSSYTFPQNNAYLTPPAVDASGNVWVATMGSEILKFDGVNWFPLPFGSANVHPETILEKNGVLYVNSTEGIYVYENGAWSNVNYYNSELSHDDVRQMAFDGQGDLWITNAVGAVLDVWHLGILSGVAKSPIPSHSGSDWQVFPNPATERLSIQKTLTGGERICIIGAQGQVWMNEQATASNNLSISISHLPAGCYWLQIEGEAKAFIKK